MMVPTASAGLPGPEAANLPFYHHRVWIKIWLCSLSFTPDVPELTALQEGHIFGESERDLGSGSAGVLALEL